jgi:hypothetical protein
MSLQAPSPAWSLSRFDPHDTGGFYESYFQRANHPSRPLAFWIRYTLFMPRGRLAAAVGELWAIFFDGETGVSTVAYERHPVAECAFSRTAFDVRVAAATLRYGELQGAATQAGHKLAWSLCYDAGTAPLLLLPQGAYDAAFPKAKSVVVSPNCEYRGHLEVDGTRVEIAGWRGSQNHNWGVRHTDHYAWGQVAGFDDMPDAFLECMTARVRVGPVWSPWCTLLVLRALGQQYSLNSIVRAPLARAHFEHFDWRFDAQLRGTRIEGRIHAPQSAFVRLTYQNPKGGEKICWNTKLASAELTLTRPGERPVQLRSARRAAFEILEDP